MIIPNRRVKRIYIFLLFVLLSAGCSPIERPEQLTYDQFVSLNQENKLGQSFLARYDGLTGFGVFVKPDTEGDGNIIFSLLSDSIDNSEIIDRVSVPLTEIQSPGYHSFFLNPQASSTNQYYLISLEVEGEGSIQIGAGEGDTYLNGALYRNGSPEDLQMMFNISYNNRLLILGLLDEGLNWLIVLSVCIWLFILPGWALLSLVLPQWRASHWSVKMGLSAGVSITIYPIILLWTDVVDLHLGALYAWFPPVAGLMVLIWNNRYTFRRSENRKRKFSDLKSNILQYIKTPLSHEPNLVVLLIILLIVGTRFWVIRNLDAAMWGDSYQHTMIAQLIVDNHGLFDSWSPYTDLITFTYHFGFHSLVAVFHWITGLSVPQATLWTGQVMNVLAVISLYPLAYRFGKNHYAGLSTILFAGLLLSLPMYYVNWGRYTQLTGQAILGSWIYLVFIYFDTKLISYKYRVLVGTVLGGLALTHYRVFLFAILFIPVNYLLFSRRKKSWEAVNRIFWVMAAAVFMNLPWISNLLMGNLPNILIAHVSPETNQATDLVQEFSQIGTFMIYFPIIVWLIIPIIIGWGLWRRDKGIALICLWWFFVFIAANPQWLHLPGSGVISNFAVFIGAYIPISLVFGIFIGWIVSRLNTMDHIPTLQPIIGWIANNRRTSFILLFSFIVILSLWGSKQRINDIRPYEHALFLRPDLNASNWIKENVDVGARLLVNSFFAYEGTAVVGSDGGWWLPLFAERATTLPPLTYVSEESEIPDYRESINNLVAEIENKGIEHPEILQMLTDRDVTHVYIGQRQGNINSPKPLLSVSQLLDSTFYKPVYHEDRVWVFQIDFQEE